MTAHIFQRKKFSTKDRELFHFTPAVRNKGKEKTTAALSGSFLFLLWRGRFRHSVYALQSQIRQKPETGGRKEPPLHYQF